MSEHAGWYLVKVIKGPLSDKELLDLATNGQLSSDSTVVHSQKSDGKIVQAGRIKEVAAALAKAKSANLTVDAAYLDFKGEVLGVTTLSDFIAKYSRPKRGQTPEAPQLSSKTLTPFLATINAERWYKEANIETARIANTAEFIKDEATGHCYMAANYSLVTVAGAKLLDMVHWFIDGALFRISGSFERKNYYAVLEAFEAKYGNNCDMQVKVYSNGYGAEFEGRVAKWSTSMCSLVLSEIDGDHSSFDFRFNSGFDEFWKRRPVVTSDL